MNNAKKRTLIFFLSILFLISVIGVNALVVTLPGQPHFIIGIHDIGGQTARLPNLGYGAFGVNLTNLSSNRPYIIFNVTTVNASSMNASLEIYAEGAGLNAYGAAGYPNTTVVSNDTSSTIYFNNTWLDGYYTWRLNVSNITSQVVPAGNSSNASDYYVLLIDTNAPNITRLESGAYSGLVSGAVNLTTRRNLFFNYSSNDSLNSDIETVGGGFVVFELHNRTTGLLNRTIFARNVFGRGAVFTTINITYITNEDLYDDRYVANVTVNDSLGNSRVSSDVVVYIDSTAPNISYNSNSQAADANITIGSIFINVSTNDTLGGKGQIGGGFVVFNLHNDSGLLNTTSFARNVFAADLIQHNILNVSYRQVADLIEGYYWYNVTVNDSLNNVIVVIQRNVTIDFTAPNTTFAAQGPSTVSTNLTVRRIFINVTTNDTNRNKPQVGGGSIIFQLRNGSGVLNTTQFELPFLKDRVQHNFINISYITINDLYDDIYILNYTINDTVGNTYRGSELTVYVDTTAPNVTYLAAGSGNGGVASADENISSGSIFINVSTNDTLNNKGQTAGGQLVFELHNSSGLLNRTQFAVVAFAGNLVYYQHLNLSYLVVDDLDDGNYTVNLTVNDSLNNRIILTSRNINLDNTAPNVTYLAAGSGNGPTMVNNEFKDQQGSIFINVSANDTFVGKNQIGGGFLTFELHNGSGLLNRTQFSFDRYRQDLVQNIGINISYLAVNDLADGTYNYNVTVNDSEGNQIILTTRNITIDRVSPAVAISSSEGSSVNRLTTTTITCNVQELNPDNITMSFSVGGDDTKGVICSGTSTCNFAFTSTIAETKTVTCSAYDKAVHFVTKTFDLTVNSDDTGGGGGGSGSSGGGGQSPIQVTTVPVVANEPFTYDVGNTYIGVDSVTITSSSSKDVKLTVAGQTVAPSDAEFPTVKVYKYFDVTQENLEEGELISAKIAFTVEDTWLSDNSATPQDVVLQRWHNSEWETYEPTYLEQDQGFHKFEVSVPGFSSFVIGLREGAGATVEPEVESEESEEPSAEGTKALPIIIVLLVLIVVGVAVWWFVNKKK